jgi:choline dehydrogenase
MPRVTNGNLNSPTMMIAEKGSDIILGKQLPASTAENYVQDEWETKQRLAEPKRAPGEAPGAKGHPGRE